MLSAFAEDWNRQQRRKPGRMARPGRPAHAARTVPVPPRERDARRPFA